MGTRAPLPDQQPDRSGIAVGGAELASLRQLAIQRAALALAAAVITGLALAGHPRVAVAFGAGSLAEVVLAFGSVASRRCRLRELATEREAYVLPEVRHFGASLATRRQRVAVARSIVALLRESSRGNSIYMLDRVAAQAPALAAVAQAVADPAVVVEPVAMANLLQLLTDGRRSPLLNPSVESQKLDQIMRRIVGGIELTPAAPAKATRSPRPEA